MAKGNAIKLNLPSADDLFSTQEERDEAKRETLIDIPIAEISDFPNHPFKVKMDESMVTLVESVKEYGVLNPALVRSKPEGGYEMIAGHRRKLASELANRQDIPCIVRNLSDDEATIVMVDSNLQREKVLPSEKAFAYKMKLDAMNRQGKRTDLTSTPVVSKLRTNEILGKETGESRETIRRYIRLTELILPILDMVDEGKIAMRPAVELSYLPKEQQQELFDTMELEDCTPSHAQAIKLRKFAEAGKLNEEVILSIMTEEKPNQVEQFKIPKVALTQEGNGGETYWSWYGFTQRVEWCACFVSWCADQCGYIEAGVVPKFSLCSAGMEWFESRGQFRDGSYVPAVGDIVFFDWGNDGSIDHVGIVESVTDGTIYTVEGNSGDQVAKRSYPLGYEQIEGFGIPEY